MWIDSKQLDADGQLKPRTAPQCGGFTLGAELGIAKNSSGEPDFLGWEVKQFAVEDFERIESAKPITMMTPEPECWRTATSGLYKNADVASNWSAAVSQTSRSRWRRTGSLRWIRRALKVRVSCDWCCAHSRAPSESVFLRVHPWLN